MNFEYDKEKSAINEQKHGINFIEAQAIWSDPDRLEIPAKEMNEPRFLVIGKINTKHWSAVMICRKENIRLISIRCSRKDEIELYENFGL